MTNKLIKRCSTSPVIKKKSVKTCMQLRVILALFSSHLTVPKSYVPKHGAAKTETLPKPDAGGVAVLQGLPSVATGNEKRRSHARRHLGSFLQNYDPAILLLGVCPKEPNTYVHTKPCTCTFMAASFITAQTWKPPPRPSAGERGTQRAVQTRDCSSALQRNELRPRKDWRKLKRTLLSERSRAERSCMCTTPTT